MHLFKLPLVTRRLVCIWEWVGGLLLRRRNYYIRTFTLLCKKYNDACFGKTEAILTTLN